MIPPSPSSGGLGREDLGPEELELLARYDGSERIPDLPTARFVAIAPASATDQPVDVLIEWAPSAVERPLPGSALWRAVLVRRLEEPPRDDPADRVVRPQIQRSLERFPDLESWWHWIRTGWTAPPRPEPGRRPGRFGQWWRRA